MTLIEERYELVKERLQDMLTEQAVSEKYTEYFHQMAYPFALITSITLSTHS